MKAWNDFNHIQKPRKSHKCVWCPEKIEVGIPHWQFIGMFEGDFQDWRCHEECREHVTDCEPDDGICEGPHSRGKGCSYHCGYQGNYPAEQMSDAVVQP
jgi:hypothetical protein